MNSTTRREALILIVAATPAAAQQPHQHSEANPSPSPSTYRPRTLTADEMRLAAILSDLIIPRTDTPGASDAGVPEFIDRRLTASAGLTQSFRHGLALLPAGFATLPLDRQTAVLAEWSQKADSAGGQFFRLIKEMTIDGYYSSRAGLAQELGWHGNTFVAEFKGCTHPEHQA
jgi:hypothetical protein